MNLSDRIFLIFASVILLAHESSAQECYSKVNFAHEDTSVVVLLDGIVVSEATKDTLLLPGKYLLSMRHNGAGWGAVLYSDTLNIARCGMDIRVDSLIKPQTSQLFIPGKNKVPDRTVVDFSRVVKKESFFKTHMFKILTGSAVLLGGIAAYYKQRADKEYDKYIETGKKEYLDRTNSLDTVSGVAFGTLQLNFGALIYFFLTD
ncbi:MAG: hypothetical protein ACM3SM_13115 [Bacteroidota bacterium]